MRVGSVTLGRPFEKLIALLTALAVVAGLALVFAPAASATHNPNNPDYWENLYPNAVECYKDDAPFGTIHGDVTDDGKNVVLNPYGASWPGDHWEVLIVKAGSSGGDDGIGNEIYEHPSSGVLYGAPDGKDVSHWIVCKGEDPVATTTSTSTTSTTAPSTTTSTTAPSTTTSTTAPSTTTSTTAPSTTTSTTAPSTTTSTTAPSTTTSTTAPSTTTSTTAPSTTTTSEPEVSPTSITTPPPESTTTTEPPTEILPTTITAAPPTTAPSTAAEVLDETLPFTGADSGPPALVALALIGIGALALVATRRAED